jgi:hypothetical protein
VFVYEYTTGNKSWCPDVYDIAHALHLSKVYSREQVLVSVRTSYRPRIAFVQEPEPVTSRCSNIYATGTNSLAIIWEPLNSTGKIRHEIDRWISNAESKTALVRQSTFYKVIVHEVEAARNQQELIATAGGGTDNLHDDTRFAMTQIQLIQPLNYFVVFTPHDFIPSMRKRQRHCWYNSNRCLSMLLFCLCNMGFSMHDLHELYTAGWHMRRKTLNHNQTNQ